MLTYDTLSLDVGLGVIRPVKHKENTKNIWKLDMTINDFNL